MHLCHMQNYCFSLFLVYFLLLVSCLTSFTPLTDTSSVSCVSVLTLTSCCRGGRLSYWVLSLSVYCGLFFCHRTANLSPTVGTAHRHIPLVYTIVFQSRCRQFAQLLGGLGRRHWTDKQAPNQQHESVTIMRSEGFIWC